MSGTARFLSFLRVGLAAAQTGKPALGALSPYSLSIAGEALAGNFRVLGPGDVLGLETSEVVREFPPASSRDHEPNLFAHVELRSADLPWRYTPGGAEGGKLRPWLVLVVVDAERRLERAAAGARLPVLRAGANELPNLAESWAWAHVQATLDDAAAVPDTAALRALYENEPQRFLARLLCPRKLEPKRHYRACLVPAFDIGRDAGLGLDVSARSELGDAWTPQSGDVSLPVYHTWTFACAGRGDFEFLADRLRPRPAPPRLGVASLDASAPGLGLPGVRAPLPLVGPLCAPGAARDTGLPSAEEKALRDALDHLVQQGSSLPLAAQDADPIVAPPRYGALQSGRTPAPAWLQALNASPAQRAIAGLGAEVVRQHQEELAASAWDQLAEVARLQKTLQRDALKEAVNVRQRQRLAALASAQSSAFLVLGRSMQATLLSGDTTFLERSRRDTDLPASVASGAAARLAVRVGRVRRRRSLAAPSAAGMTAACTAAAKRPDFAPRPAPGARTLIAEMDPVEVSGLAQIPNVPAGPAAGPNHPAKGHTAAAPAPGFRGGGTIAQDFWAASDPAPFLRARRRRLVKAGSELGLGDAGRLPARLAPPISFRTPFGEVLAAMSPEQLLPRVGDLPNESIVTAEVNPSFVEAFLAGMND
ncbi:MAG TPA: hypothetical protein VMG12_39095, partial [Polyangiaceae bacterium]|nr:hypothetical protein [Polyangiaceae bacterium]